jgi:hypothetical protein
MSDLPDFPVDDETVALVLAAARPDWGTTERSSVMDLCRIYSEMAGSDLTAVAEFVDAEVRVMRDPVYHFTDIIASLAAEVQRLRGVAKR